MKCKYCNSCLRIKRVNLEGLIDNFYVCEFCGRVYSLEGDKVVYTPQIIAEAVRKYLNLTKVGEDEQFS